MITNATVQELQSALVTVNEKTYGGNLIFNRLEAKGRRVHFTLRVQDSHKLGARLSCPHLSWTTKKGNEYKQRHMVSACWHAHGHFFEALFEVNPEAWIKARGNKIDKNGGNWEDFDIGSVMYPAYMSELCECDRWVDIQAEAKQKAMSKIPSIPVYWEE